MIAVKTIYNLREDRGRIAKAQAASLSSKPFGLKATHGLFGSEEWWHNLETGVIPLIRRTGNITRLFRAGMHNESQCFEMGVTGGQKFQYDCVAMDRTDRAVYKVGAYIELLFVEEELKQPVLTASGAVYDTHSHILIEIRISKATQ